jgi:hypothetical protein
MTKISIEIDTENGDLKTSGGGKLFRSRLPGNKKLGILSSVDLQYAANVSPLATAIGEGYGSNIPKQDHHHRIPPGQVKANRDELLSAGHPGGRCDIIATIGGLWVNSEVNDDNRTDFSFVSLVGNAPASNPTGCLGGVSLDTWKSNSLRRGFLTIAPRNVPLVNIALYQDAISRTRDSVQQYEYDEWNGIAGLGPIYNSTRDFNADLNVAGGVIQRDANILALVISASPYFQLHKNELVTAANTWVNAANTRYVVYPLQIYNDAMPAPQTTLAPLNRSILYGPDLYQACRVLGFLAKEAAESGTDAGFFAAPNLVPPVQQ